MINVLKRNVSYIAYFVGYMHCAQCTLCTVRIRTHTYTHTHIVGYMHKHCTLCTVRIRTHTYTHTQIVGYMHCTVHTVHSAYTYTHIHTRIEHIHVCKHAHTDMHNENGIKTENVQD